MKLLSKIIKKASSSVNFQERPGAFSGKTRYAILLINFLIVVCSIALMAAGAVILISEHLGIARVTHISMGTFSICVGVVIFVFAMFGSYAVFRGNNTMLHLYTYILVVLFILQVALGLYCHESIQDNYTFKNNARGAVEEVFNRYVRYNNSEMENTVDSIQEFFGCCGVDGPAFWLMYLDKVPSSCYKNRDPYTRYSNGCLQCYTSRIKTNIRIVEGFSFGFSIVELFGAIFICFVRNRNY